MIIKNEFKPSSETKTFGTILSSAKDGSKLIIPNSYQRDYSWSNKEIKTLIDDLYETFLEEENICYLGKIILSSTSYREKSIVDGQQRITTLFMILHSIALKTNNNHYISKLYHGASERRDQGLILEYSFKMFNNNLLNLKCCSDNPLNNGYSIINRLLYDESSDTFIDSSEYDDFASCLLERVIIETQEIPSEYQEDYFIDINDKGIRLNEIDKIKSVLRSNVINSNKFDFKWANIINELDFISIDSFSRGSNKNRLHTIMSWYNKINGHNYSYYYSITSEDIVFNFLDELLDLIKFSISILSESGKYYNETMILRYFSEYSFIPYAWKMSKKYNINNVFKLITLLSICNKNGESWRLSLNRLYNNFSYSFEDFYNQISNVEYKHSKVIKGILVLSESILRKDVNLVDQNKEFIHLISRFKNTPPRERLSLEHISPQSIELEKTHDIGNITLLTLSENTEVKDKTKFNTYLGTEFILTNILCNGKKHELEIFSDPIKNCQSYNQDQLDCFSEDDILKRKNYIISLIYNHFKIQ